MDVIQLRDVSAAMIGNKVSHDHVTELCVPNCATRKGGDPQLAAFFSSFAAAKSWTSARLIAA